jgi:hypothetical protein
VAVRNSHSKVLLECLECVLLKTRLVEVDTHKVRRCSLLN